MFFAVRIVCLAVDGIADSAHALVRDVFAGANLLAHRVDIAAAPFDVRTCAFTDHVRTSYGADLPTEPWSSVVQNPPDIVITPSLGLVTADEVIDAVRDNPALPTLRSLRAQGVQLAGACSGTFFLGEAGVLDGLDATTGWWLGPPFRARYPRVRLDEAQALVSTNGVTTAGAALAHLDMALSIVRRVSPALAEIVASYLAVGDRPKQSAVAIRSSLVAGDPLLTAFDRYVRDNMRRPIAVNDVAAALGVSQRTLQRATSATLGVPPIRFVQQVRLDHAVHMLRTSEKSLGEIAESVGYRDAATLRSLIRRQRGVTVTELRRQRRSALVAT